jgi:signal transduction histidine kinase
MLGIRISVYAIAAVSAAVMVAVALLPAVDLASSAPSLRVAVGAMPPLFALAAGVLVLGRFRRRDRLNDLALACSLGTLALSIPAFVTVPLVLQRFWPDLWIWAALAERWRIERELHDGPVQELAYLMRNIDSLNGTVDKETRAYLRRAAERAEIDIRLAIEAIATPHSQSVSTAIAQAAGEVAARDHIKLELGVAQGIRLPTSRADAPVRIACEAASNAGRPSGAAQVSPSLQRQGDGARLRVGDGGAGFDPGSRVGAFGLTSIPDRPASVGGDLRISSVPGRATEVEAQL